MTTEIPKLITDTNKYFQYEGSTDPTTQDELQAFMKNEHSVVRALTETILWQPSTAYEKGQEIRSPNMPAGFSAVCKTAGISGTNEPDWGAGGTDITDASCVWTVTKGNITVNGISPDETGNITIAGYTPSYASDAEAIAGTASDKTMTPKATDAVIENIGYWKPNTAVSKNVIRFIRGTAYAGYYLECNTAGTTGSTEPQPAVGTTALITDGTAKWYLRKMISANDMGDSVITGKNITVTKSTQSAITPSGNCAGDWSDMTISNLVTVTAGISAGTYTLKNLLQQLVNKSHSHGTRTISLDCNCDCDCGDSTCIVSGSVLTEKGLVDISHIKAGDLVYTDKGFKEVVDVVLRKVGNRKCLQCDDLVITADHPIKNYLGYVSVFNKDGFEYENNIVYTGQNGIKAGYFLDKEIEEITDCCLVYDLNSQLKSIKFDVIKCNGDTSCYLPVFNEEVAIYVNNIPLYTGKVI